MLTAKVGQTRTIQSTAFTVALEGDLPASLEDAEAVLAKVGELFALAEEALRCEIERCREPHPTPAPSVAGPAAKPTRPEDEPITPKQVQYLQNLSKKHGLAGPELDAEISRVVGRRTAIRGLSKREAGRVIDAVRNLPVPSEEPLLV